MIWEINRIKQVFENTCYGDEERILTELKKCYNYYRSVNIENKFCLPSPRKLLSNLGT